MITLDKRAICDHGRHPAYCGVCLREWAEHMEVQRLLDEELEAARVMAGCLPASDREYDSWLDLMAPRAEVGR